MNGQLDIPGWPFFVNFLQNISEISIPHQPGDLGRMLSGFKLFFKQGTQTCLSHAEFRCQPLK
jgi:hypothetical protein